MKDYCFDEIKNGAVFRYKQTQLKNSYFYFRKVSNLHYKDLLEKSVFKIGCNGFLGNINISALVQETFTLASRAEIKAEYEYAKRRGYLCR